MEKYFDNYEFLLKRPEGMSTEEYREKRKAQKKVIKMYLKGQMVHLSKLYPTPEVLKHFCFTKMPSALEIYAKSLEPGNESVMLLLKGFTYYARTKDIQE